MGTRFSDSEHVSPIFVGVLKFWRVLEKGVLFLRVRTRFSDSEHVSPIFSEFGVGSFGKTCSEKRVPSQNTFLRLRTRFSEIFGVRSSEFLEKRVLSENTFLRLRTRFSEIFGVRSSEFRKNVFESEHVDSEHVSPNFFS